MPLSNCAGWIFPGQRIKNNARNRPPILVFGAFQPDYCRIVRQPGSLATIGHWTRALLARKDDLRDRLTRKRRRSVIAPRGIIRMDYRGRRLRNTLLLGTAFF